MNNKTLCFFLIAALFSTTSCQEAAEDKVKETINQTNTFDSEKTAILNVINGETKAAFNRDYEGWKAKWIHEQYVTKTYMNFPDNSMSETLGWSDINQFVKTYIEQHPEPAPIPTLVDKIDVRLYGNGAWVNYVQNDSKLGLKRETRLMEKLNGQWKIAGMQTIIYGFKNEE